MWKPHEHTRAQRTLRLHLVGAGLQASVGLIVTALTHHVRNHWRPAPRGGRRHLSLHHAHQATTCPKRGAVHIDVRVGLITRHRIRELHHIGMNICVHVIGHR